MSRPSQQLHQQVSSPRKAESNLHPQSELRERQPVIDNLRNEPNDEEQPNESQNNVNFAQKDGNIVPVGPEEQYNQHFLPLPYALVQEKDNNKGVAESKIGKVADNVGDEPEKSVLAPPNKRNVEDEPEKNVLAPPNEGNGLENMKKKSSSTKGPQKIPILRPQVNIDTMQRQNPEGHHFKDFDEVEELQGKIPGILSYE